MNRWPRAALLALGMGGVGPSAARLRVSVSGKLVVVTGASRGIGRAIARIFTGFLTREFGEEAFKVERVGGPPPVGPELKATGAA